MPRLKKDELIAKLKYCSDPREAVKLLTKIKAIQSERCSQCHLPHGPDARLEEISELPLSINSPAKKCPKCSLPMEIEIELSYS